MKTHALRSEEEDDDGAGARHRRALLIALALMLIPALACVSINLPPEKDVSAKEVWLPKAEKGDVTSQFVVGQYYRYGRAGLASDAAQATRWLQAAAKQGHTEAQIALGDMLLRGEVGQKPDPEAGMRWLQRAAENNDPALLQHIAAYYESGEWVAQDPGKALAWYLRAAEAGSMHACLRLGQYYENGRGVASDPVRAYQWYWLARSGNDLERLEKRLSLEQIAAARSRAAQWQRERASERQRIDAPKEPAR